MYFNRSWLVQVAAGLILASSFFTNSSTYSQEAKPPQILIPHNSWDCELPKGIPLPEVGELFMEVEMQSADDYDLGQTQYGHRRVIVTGSGKFHGSNIEGDLLAGGLDLQLELDNGVIEIEQLLNMKTTDGKNIFIRSAGVGASRKDIRIVFHFEAPNDSEHSWLNAGTYVGRRTIDEASGMLRLQIHQVPEFDNHSSLSSISIAKPENVPSQSWDYRRAEVGEEIGEILITENVTLGPSLMVGRSRTGMRNTIPITGGTLKGKINGKVLNGGADYQQLTPPAVIDARYLWQTEEGEIILVRNAGAFGKLVPTFEAKKDGKYAWLNDGKYLSSNPGMGSGGVKLTFYESR